MLLKHHRETSGVEGAYFGFPDSHPWQKLGDSEALINQCELSHASHGCGIWEPPRSSSTSYSWEFQLRHGYKPNSCPRTACEIQTPSHKRLQMKLEPSVKRVTYSPLPFVCSVWSHRHDQGRCPTEASCLEPCQKFTFACVAYGRKGWYNLLCKIHSTKRARLKTIYPALRGKKV